MLSMCGSSWVLLGVNDVIKEVTILRFKISDFTIGFLTPKHLPLLIYMFKQLWGCAIALFELN